MTWKKPDARYWENKFIAYMHDPFEKVFSIRGHERRAEELLSIYGLDKPNNEYWKKADGIAAGFERGDVLSYSSDENKSGAVDFGVITHPISKTSHLKIDMSGIDADTIFDELKKFLGNEIGVRSESNGLSSRLGAKFNNRTDEAYNKFCVARVLYTHLALRHHLSEKNVGGIGALWHRLPADTRFPDHSIWQHNALVAALSSSMELSDENGTGLCVFSITPVQSFISNARKLRDFWTGSVMLSWLAFEGIRWIMENLGPDHVIYPSLIDQPLITEYLKKWEINNITTLSSDASIASFPNKFLFVIPLKHVDDITAEISKHIQAEWMKIGDMCKKRIVSEMKLAQEQQEVVKELFERQFSDYWDFQWAATPMLDKGSEEYYKKLLKEDVYKMNDDVIKEFEKLYTNDRIGALYSVTHSLAQSLLAATKSQRCVKRKPENGEKCHLCGEFEVLHDCSDVTKGAANYNNGIKHFWNVFTSSWNIQSDVREGEKLCSICLSKRILYRVLKDTKGHILNATFAKADTFPTTTEMALHNYYQKKNILDKAKQKNIADELYSSENDHIKDIDERDKYYAILFMDGDKMGDLINGKTFTTTWEDIMPDDLVKRMKRDSYDKDYKNAWATIFPMKRMVTPAIHAAISESLGDFSLYHVAPIIEKYNGRLIYAGGDDVCAVLPIDTALLAADEIRRAYINSFVFIDKDRKSSLISNSVWKPEIGKLSINMGSASEGISISAGILLCHHKENLGNMMQRAHILLSEHAKEKKGRNACAIEMKKRSGGSRYAEGKWTDEKYWNAFEKIGECVNGNSENDNRLSTSLVYRMEQFRDGIQPLIDADDSERLKRLKQFIAKQIERSYEKKISKEKVDEMADAVYTLTITEDPEDKVTKFLPEPLIVAGFIYERGK